MTGRVALAVSNNADIRPPEPYPFDELPPPSCTPGRSASRLLSRAPLGTLRTPVLPGGRLPNASRAAVGHSDLRFDDKPPLGSVTTPVIDPKVLWAMLTEEKAKLIRISPRTNRCLSNIFPPQKLRRTRDITNPRSVQSRLRTSGAIRNRFHAAILLPLTLSTGR